MEIINCHVHAIDLEGMQREYPDLALSYGIATLASIEETLPLLDPRSIMAQMDEAGISQSVLYAMDAPILYAPNEYVAGICKAHGDRFIGFASVNPGRENAGDVLKNAIENMGLKGVKFHPPLQNFFPNDESVFHIYQTAADLGVPVVFHVGSTPFGKLCRLSQANPLLIDDVAVAFPDLKIILTHLGTLWQNEAFMVVEKNPNVFIDTAAYLYEIEEILTESLIMRIGADKILFGTDYPMPSPPDAVHTMKDFVDQIKALSISTEMKEKIFSKNFKRLLTMSGSDFRKSLSIKDMISS